MPRPQLAPQRRRRLSLRGSSGPRAIYAALALVVLAVSCVTGIRAPKATPNGTLSLKNGDGSNPDAGPLAVVFASPVGELRGPSEITVLFNKPMRALELAGGEAPFPGVIEPPVEGAWHWVGTRAASFIPARPKDAEGPGGGSFRLLAATKYKVTIPKGTKSVDGDALAEEYAFEFSTERPEVAATRPWNNDSKLVPDAEIQVRFTQPVDDAEILRAAQLTAGSASVPFEVKRSDPKNRREATLVPKAKLPLDTSVSLAFDASLKGVEGELPMGKSASYNYRTYGPLEVSGVRCNDYGTPHGRCDPTSAITVSFTNEVKFKDAKRAITIPGLKLVWPSYYDDDDLVSSVSIGAKFRAAQSYSVHVAPPLVDEFGQALASSADASVAFDDFWPIAHVGMSEGVFEAKTGKKEPTVSGINADDLRIVTVALSQDDVLAMNAEGSVTYAALSKRPGAREAAGTKGKKNTLVRDKLSVSEVLGGDERRGAFAVAITYGTGRGAEMTEENAIAQITDLAITAKVSKAGTLVWVTHLADASVVAGAKVEIRRPGEKTIETTTDAEGFATFDKGDFVPRFENEKAIVFVSTADDTCFKVLGDEVENWDFSSHDDELFGLMFTDRGIYRPGDKVKVKGIVREELWNGTATPGANHKVHVEVRSPLDDKVLEVDRALSAYGTFDFEIQVPASGSLGAYDITAKPDKGGMVSQTFEVAEYRPTEFEVRAESDRPSYQRGDSATWTARGAFLFGAAMSGAQVSTYVSRSETWFQPDGTAGFDVDDRVYYSDLPDTHMRESVVTSSDGHLDSKGLLVTQAALAMPGQRGPEMVTANVDVTDLSRQVVSTSTTALVHPAEYYVGVLLADAFVASGTKLEPKFIAVTPKGDRVAGRPLEVSLIRRKWVVAKQSSGESAFATTSSVSDQVVGTCALASAAAPVGCTLAPTEGGYYVVRVTSTDTKSNPVAAATSLYVTGSTGGGWSDGDDSDVELVSDKPSYSVGDTARVLVKSPYASVDALVTVERGGVYTKRVMKLSGPTPTIDVPITEDLRPNAFVSVMLLKGRSTPAPTKIGAADVGAPSYRLGFVELSIDPKKKRLDVAVKPSKTDYKPGEDIEVEVDVKDADGKGATAEVTLYAVDEAVLSLIAYKTPDPVDVFASPRPLKVATLESRARLARLYDPLGGLGADKGLAGGGGGEGPGGGKSTRKDFRSSAYFNPSLVTDAAGHAKVSFKLPDSLTTYRVMAVVASADDRFGFAEKRVTTSRPLMARPTFPRFLRAGDAFESGVIVTSKGAATADIDVSLAVSGVVRLDGDAKQTVHLAAGESQEVRFKLAATAVGAARFRFDVEGGGEKDSVEITREVRVPMVLEAVALYGSTTQESAEKLGDLSAVRSDAGELTLSVSSSALVGLDGGANQLLEYPYGCTEQLASRLVPIVNLRSLSKDFHLAIPANADDVVDKTVAGILAHQKGDGGFGLWPDSPEPNIWVTAYAFWSLKQAQNNGATVPVHALASAAEYMHKSIDQLESSAYGLALRAFVVDVLSQYDAPDPGRISSLFESRGAMPLFGKALLLHAMALAGSDRSSVEVLTKEVESSIRLDGAKAMTAENSGNAFVTLLDSETRTTALVLRALLAVDPNHRLGSALAAGLLSARDGGAWRSTQETAWSLVALADYRRAQESAEPDFDAHLFVGETEVAGAAFHGRSLSTTTHVVPAGTLTALGGSTLGFSVEGTGKLFYEARLRYARTVLPTDVIDRGFYVERRMRAVTADTLGAALDTVPDSTTASFKGGDLVLVDVVVVTPEPREFVVVDDALPAGFEAVDSRLATTSSRLDIGSSSPRRHTDDDDASDDENASWYRREVRDDRVLFFVDHMAAGVYRYRYLARATSIGRFVVPPSKAENMYAPEVFGRTGAATIEVAP